jgi:hypothetical protein
MHINCVFVLTSPCLRQAVEERATEIRTASAPGQRSMVHEDVEHQ